MTQSRVTETRGGSSVAISEPVPVLQLRGATSNHPTKDLDEGQRSKVHWKEDVVDNEHMNKKKSKVCCIFHPQQNFEDIDAKECDHHHSHDEASSSSSSSSSESDAENSRGMDFESRRKARKERRHRKLQQKRSSSPNAYEVQPDYSKYRDKSTNTNVDRAES
ncbi:type 1 protein phosphatase-activating protein YPI1 LALA0_S08e04984g [Lachancea lanzarotensis]|uniref:Type 1 phosphatases regulator n=1 Tax=Lachancea lanzarotensis TaxID=1245769 RepID=A0A0C7N0C3_9SACH|nr:uncharacterized protein LALA0_S08e04984g [Lachancea lanzarotensis]CEP63546.1 LALA0S08e04984g1_1 [Lachancea lanzarotensis]